MSDMFDVETVTGITVTYKDEMRPTLIQTEETFETLLSDMANWPYIVTDLETTGLSFMHHEIVGVALTSLFQSAYYIPIRHRLVRQQLQPEYVLPKLQSVLRTKQVVAHNFKFDFNFLFTELLRYVTDADFNATHDTMLMHQVLEPSKVTRHALKLLIKRYFGVEMLCFEGLVDGGEDFSFVPLEDAVLYAGGDVFWTCKLFELLKTKLCEQTLVFTYNIEMQCLKAFCEMERVGLPVDRERLGPTLQHTKLYLEKLSREIYKIAGHDFLITSPQELSHVLFEEIGIQPGPKTEDNKYYSTADPVLQARKDWAIVRKIIEYRTLDKLITSFLGKANDVICEDGRLHPGFNQCSAASGRVTSSGGIGPKGINPKLNAQNFPKQEDKDDINFRAFLVAPEDYYWLSADFKQIEYMLMACLSGEEELIEGFRQGIDFHIATAALMFGISIKEVTKALRRKGKTINFGVCYGMSHYSLARALGITPNEAQGLMNQYFSKLKRLQAFIEMTKKYAYEQGEVRTAFGRKRDFSDLKTQKDKKILASRLRAAFNTAIQGTAADINKMGVAAVYKAKAKYGNKILMALNVHDELSLFIHKSIPLEEATEVILNLEQDFPDRGWPRFKVDPEYGSNYGSLKKVYGDDEEDESDEPEFSDFQTAEDFDRIILVTVGEWADFDALKMICSPARKFAYRVILKSGSKFHLLPSSYSFNPTNRMLERLKEVDGVLNVEVKVVEDAIQNN